MGSPGKASVLSLCYLIAKLNILGMLIMGLLEQGQCSGEA